MSNYIGGVALPPISQAFLDTVSDAFPVPDVYPGADRDQLMFSAGARHVVEWIKTHSSTNASSGDPVQAQKAVVRMGS